MMNFIFFSINNWEKRKARKQHFALELSKRSDVERVVYVEPALNFWRGILFPWREFKTEENRMRWKRALWGSPYQVNEKLLVLSPLFFIPFEYAHQSIYDLNMYFVSIWLQHLLKPDTQSVLWFYNPFDRVLMRYLKLRALTIFDWAEDWQQYFIELNTLRRAQTGYLQEDMIRRSDLVFVVSQAMCDRAKQLNVNTFHVMDGTVPEVFLQQVVSGEVLNLHKPVCGYLGTLNHRVDGELLLSLAKRFPDISFLFIGDILLGLFDAKPFAQCANVYFIGGREYYALGAYNAVVDIWLLPYKPSLTGQLPTKVFDYLVTGKPIVSTRIEVLKGLEHFFYVGDTPEQIAVCIERALREDNLELRNARITFANENSWQKRTEQIVGYINRKR